MKIIFIIIFNCIFTTLIFADVSMEKFSLTTKSKFEKLLPNKYQKKMQKAKDSLLSQCNKSKNYSTCSSIETETVGYVYLLYAFGFRRNSDDNYVGQVLKAGVSPNVKRRSGLTLIDQYPCPIRHTNEVDLDALKHMVEAGFDLNAVPKYKGRNYRHFMTKVEYLYKYPECFNFYVNQKGCGRKKPKRYKTYYDTCKETLLHQVLYGIKILTVASSRNKNNPIQINIKEYNESIRKVNLLLERGLNPNRQAIGKECRGRKTPFDMAVGLKVLKRLKVKLYKPLLEHGANVNKKSSYSDLTPICEILEQQRNLSASPEIMKRLMEQECFNYNIAYSDLSPACENLEEYISYRTSPETIKLFIKHGARPEECFNKKINLKDYKAFLHSKRSTDRDFSKPKYENINRIHQILKDYALKKR